METRLNYISKALAEIAINSFNSRATFVKLITGELDIVVSRVYDELLLGVKNKISEFKLAKNITKIALLAYWQSINKCIDTVEMSNLEFGSVFQRTVLATHATLKKMIKRTNEQRKQSKVLLSYHFAHDRYM
jgi:hypothetical protein